MQPGNISPMNNQSQPRVLTEKELRTNRLKTLWGIICLVAPTALAILVTFAYAGVNFLMASSGNSDPFNDSPIESAMNVAMFVVMALVVLTWLPGIIVGIILLATKK